MAMLRSGNRKSGHSAGSGTSGQDPRITILAAGTRITGKLETAGVLRIEGTLEGNLHAHGQVLVASGGIVKGDIDTREAVVGGEVRGQVHAAASVRVQAGGEIHGDITTPRIAIEEGGTIDGYLRMANPQSGQRTTPSEQQQAKDRPHPREEGRGSTGSGSGEIELLRSVG